MKKLISITAILMLALFVVSVSSCKKDDAEADTHYNLKLENNTEQDYDVYMKNNASGLDFIKQGTVPAHTTLELKDLTIALHYTLRVVVPGNSVDNYEQELTFTSDNNVDDYILKINP